MATFALLVACNDTSFKSDNPKRAADVVAKDPDRQSSDATLKLACEDGEGEARLVTELKGTAATTVRLEGEFCGLPTTGASGKLSMLFLVDFSGSMKDNDPLVAGSCGRLAAARAIVDRLEAQMGPNVEIKVGMTPFSTLAMPGLPLQDLAAFKAQLSAEAICMKDVGDTNYQAAFTAAHAALKNDAAAKVVYFISDGLPRLAGGGTLGEFVNVDLDEAHVYESGRQAAAALRAIPNLTLNTIFVGSPSTLGATIDSQTYLEQITGDKSRVRLVANAGDLAAEILKFDTPDAVQLDAASVAATVKAPAFGENVIEVESLTADPARAGVWLFVTKPFPLFADAKKAVANEVTLTVQGADGKPYKATARITFDLEDE